MQVNMSACKKVCKMTDFSDTMQTAPPQPPGAGIRFYGMTPPPRSRGESTTIPGDPFTFFPPVLKGTESKNCEVSPKAFTTHIFHLLQHEEKSRLIIFNSNISMSLKPFSKLRFSSTSARRKSRLIILNSNISAS